MDSRHLVLPESGVDFGGDASLCRCGLWRGGEDFSGSGLAADVRDFNKLPELSRGL